MSHPDRERTSGSNGTPGAGVSGRWCVVLVAVSLVVGPSHLKADGEGGGSPGTLVNGDSNCDGHVDLSDAVHLLAYLYLGAGPPCPLADRPELLQEVADLKAQVKNLEAEVAAKVAELAQATERLAHREAELQAQLAAREVEFQAALAAKDAELKAKAEEVAACQEDLRWWKATHWEECRNRPDRFVRNGDGTVTDTCTDLLWQQTPADLNGDGVFNYNDTRFPLDRTEWNSAKAYADGLSLGGHDDWRLPEVEELVALRQDESVTLATPQAGCLPFAFNAPGCCDLQFWTATPFEFRSPNVDGPLAWSVACGRPFSQFVWMGWSTLTNANLVVLAVRNP